MAYHVYFTNHPDDGPTHGQKCSKSSTLFFKSVGYNDGDSSLPFEIKFDSNILTNYHKGNSDLPKGAAGDDARTWVSQKVGSYHRVKIVLKGNAHPTNGYKYDVTISGKTLDPRVVPR
jgi:hypothetical protein